MRRNFFSVLVLAAVSRGLTGCDGNATAPLSEETEPFSYQWASAGITSLDLTGITGSVQVTGTAPGTPVVVRGVRRVRAHSRSEAADWIHQLRIESGTSGERVFVGTDQPSSVSGVEFIVDYEVFLPRAAHLRVRHVTGAVVIEGRDGSVDIENVTGAVALDDVEGDLVVELTTGTVAGAVGLAQGGSISLSVVTGTIALSVPRTAPGTLSASVVTGQIQLVGISGTDQDPRQNAVFVSLGSGAGTIDLDVVTGTIQVTGR